ncbi:MAG: UDP-N-acetylmuramoyl-tripeptide--D-alanyl-D-alanine ligase [Gammaproteobacteria bacterium]|jgi:UDP-N-acetylmuramoyl-tripeptide--D-alanyl-D-alanine ligase|nr:UDP-N-acetylmuramoyl-tripeptide--D-alanyl-D-alanine ligase [Gammaproteobacteria bacterium]
MMRLSLHQISQRIGAHLHLPAGTNAAQLQVQGVAIDSRKLLPGMLFLALPGAHVDGHDYLPAAAAAGAVAAVVSSLQPVDLPQLLVEDVAAALSELARSWRNELSVTVIAVTGSNGKTTVKEMLEAIFQAAVPAPQWLATAGNYNNELGVPLTLLRLSEEHRFAVVEMGCGQAGDIALLAKLAQPRIGIVTSIGPAHLQRLGTLQGVALAKSELLEALPGDGLALFPQQAEHADILRQASHCAVQTIGASEASEQADVVWQRCGDQVDIRAGAQHISYCSKLPGEHNAANAALAAAAALALGFTSDVIASGLANVQAAPGRWQLLSGRSDSHIINDSYNANPASLHAAMQAQASAFAGHERWLVLGNMGELGAQSVALHAAAGEQARALGISKLYACGDLAAHAAQAFGSGAEVFSDRAALLRVLPQRLHAGVVVLVKGSRSAGLELVVDQLVQPQHAAASPGGQRGVHEWQTQEAN